MITKKSLFKSISIILVVSMLTVCAFAADGDAKTNGRHGDRHRNAPERERPGFSRGFSDENLASVKEEISALEDEKLKTELNELIDKYEKIYFEVEAVEKSDKINDKMTELNEAEKSLREALRNADILVNPDGAGGGEKSRDGRREKGTALRLRLDVDTEKLSEAIDALNDDAVKSKLTGLLESYKEKCAAIVDKTDIDEEALKELRGEAMAACDELIAAVKEAGIELNDYINDAHINGNETDKADKAEKPEPKQEKKPTNNIKADPKEEPASDSSAPDDSKQQSISLWNKILSWFK